MPAMDRVQSLRLKPNSIFGSIVIIEPGFRKMKLNWTLLADRWALSYQPARTRLCLKRGLTLWRRDDFPDIRSLAGEGQTPFQTEPRLEF